jgi:hypothetical protein
MSLILHDNIIEGITPTVSDEVTGYEGVNVSNWLLYNSWKAGTTGTVTLTYDMTTTGTADCFAAYGHNLGTEGCTIKVEYSTDDITYADAFTAITPTSDEVLFIEFTTQTKRYWRVSIGTSTADSLVSVIAFGAATTLPKGQYDGYRPPLRGAVKSIVNVSSSGNFLGKSVTPKPMASEITQKNVTQSFVRGDWATFRTHADTKPFFFSWDENNYSGETVYAWADPKKPDKVSYINDALLQVSYPIQVLL